ncbi:MAG: hypothetical protein V2A74_01955 [bacterium]
MPSIRPIEPESSSGLFSGKMLLLLLLILGTLGYAGYQYLRLRHPAPTPVAGPASSSRLENLRGDQLLERLNLTATQKDQIASLKKNETDPAKLRRATLKLLTPTQRDKLRDLRQFQAEKKKERTAKYYPGSELAIAKEADKKVKQQTEQRRKAAQSARQKPKAAPTPTPAPTTNGKSS